MRTRTIVVLAVVALTAAACGGGDDAPSGVGTSDDARGEEAAAPTATASSVDTSRLPIGDGKYGSSPAIGTIDACQTRFGGAGAFATGDWIHDDGTFDLEAKPTVDGSVTWDGSVTISRDGSVRRISSDGVPADHTTGVFPIAATDDAFAFDRNPNRITTQSVSLSLPADPTVATEPSCLPMGAIGVMTSGVVVFNGLDAGGRDAVAHEIQDACSGHPQQQGVYHYHSGSDCFDDPGTGHSVLLGYALDGFGIYGSRGEDGVEVTSADLDECHGHTHAIAWDGETVAMYHYHLTADYPYTLGCFRGTPTQLVAAG